MKTSQVSCEICGNSEVDILSHKDRDNRDLRTVICIKCGLVWVDPRPNQKEIENFYSDDYRKIYKGNFQPKPKHCYRETKRAIGRMNRFLSVYKNGYMALDVGSGGGFFPYVLSRTNIFIDGVEPNKDYAEFSRIHLKLKNITTGFLTDITAENHYDIITINHVFEHFDSPRKGLQHMAKLLKNNGCIIMEIPNIDATYHSPDKIFHVGHLYWFNPATISALALQEGFVIEDLKIIEGTQHINLILRKSPESEVVNQENIEKIYKENFEHIIDLYKNYTKTGHYLTLKPYKRLFGKIIQYVNEYKATEGKNCPEICEEVINGSKILVYK
jgi:2-polyprenyl-3-methyl-5-hydroxy-6-metoxy-1,4-benzoquinol methylase